MFYFGAERTFTDLLLLFFSTCSRFPGYYHKPEQIDSLLGEAHKDIRYTTNDTLLDIRICGEQGPFTLHHPAYTRHGFTNSVRRDAILLLPVTQEDTKQAVTATAQLLPLPNRSQLSLLHSVVQISNVSFSCRICEGQSGVASSADIASGQKGHCALTLAPEDRDC